MTKLEIRPVRPLFVAEIQGPELRSVDDGTVAKLQEIFDTYAVCVFRNQRFEDNEQLTFAKRIGAQLHTNTIRSAVDGQRRRLEDDGIADISNLDEYGGVLGATDPRRLQALGNRLWHTDGSFVHPPARFSMLSARGIMPAEGGETEYADMRGAYESLPEEMKQQINGLRAHHTIVYSLATIGFDDLSDEQRTNLGGADQPLVRTNPRTGRKALYVASHASHIVGLSVPEGRILLRELIALATLPQLVYRHVWHEGDFVVWDNLATMHRGRAFDESQPRDLRRVTTLAG